MAFGSSPVWRISRYVVHSKASLECLELKIHCLFSCRLRDKSALLHRVSLRCCTFRLVVAVCTHVEILLRIVQPNVPVLMPVVVNDSVLEQRIVLRVIVCLLVHIRLVVSGMKFELFDCLLIFFVVLSLWLILFLAFSAINHSVPVLYAEQGSLFKIHLKAK